MIGVATQILTAKATEKATIVGARILAGFAAAPVEYLPAVTINDLLFIHRRGFGLSLYILALTIGSTLGPTAAGLVISPLGWRWVSWILSILLGSNAILILLCFEETGFPRHLYPLRVDDAVPESTQSNVHTRSSYISKLKLWTHLPQAPGQSVIRNAVMPLRLAFEPIVIYCGFLYGLAITCLSIMSVTAVTVFQNPNLPYKFRFSDVGLTNFGTFIGAMLSLYIGGAGTDRFMIWKAKRNNGIMEPESRLYAVLIAGPLMSAGLMLYGMGAYNSDPWIVLVLGMALVGAGIPIAGEVSLGYVSESYPSLTGEATTAVILIRNFIGCGMTFAIQPWIDSSGLKITFISVGIMALAIFYVGILFIWKGKACRARSAKLYLSVDDAQVVATWKN